MPIRLTCKSCGKDFGAKEEWVGKKLKCPHCGTVSVVKQTTGDTTVSEPSISLQSESHLEPGMPDPSAPSPLLSFPMSIPGLSLKKGECLIKGILTGLLLHPDKDTRPSVYSGELFLTTHRLVYVMEHDRTGKDLYDQLSMTMSEGSRRLLCGLNLPEVTCLTLKRDFGSGTKLLCIEVGSAKYDFDLGNQGGWVTTIEHVFVGYHQRKLTEIQTSNWSGTRKWNVEETQIDGKQRTESRRFLRGIQAMYFQRELPKQGGKRALQKVGAGCFLIILVIMLIFIWNIVRAIISG